MHLSFVTELYWEQLVNDRYFLHEHPAAATSWQESCIQQLSQAPGVARITADQCQYGAEVISGIHAGFPIKKPTGFLSNAPAILYELRLRCDGRRGECSRPKGGRHIHCEGRICREAAKYSRKLCRAMIRGMHRQMRLDGTLQPGCIGMMASEDEKIDGSHVKIPEEGFSGKYRDNLTGQLLKDVLVHEARMTELQYFNQKGVWVKCPHGQARAVTGRPPISVRWIDVNKGDDASPRYRSRLVARQLKARDHSGENFFAPAPPIEALRAVLSMATTSVGSHKPNWDPRSPTRTQISMIDVARAYFNAECDPAEPTFVELPPEDNDSPQLCARLLRHMYGTRRAADGWQEEYSTMLIQDLGFKQGSSVPNVFHHAERGIFTSVHGDDFTSTGPCDQLNWMEAAIAERYEITIQPRLGPGDDDAKSGVVLNRIIRWCPEGLEYEADPRQIERLIAECGMDGSKPIGTPGIRTSFKDLESDEPLKKALYTAFRGAAARGNYLATDRPDVQFACKEVCRFMSSPTSHSWMALKRLCRFLAGAPRMVYRYERQHVEVLDIYTDTDWAGCPRTRKNTSGGCVMFGKHTVKHWSSTQASVTLSSGEAEFHGVVKGAGVGLGFQALLRDFGLDVPVRLWTDSSAAIGICSRQGLGKLRHLDTKTLWIQQAVRTGAIQLRKVPGVANPADLFTKHSLSKERVLELLKLFSCDYRGGRPANAPQVKQGASTKKTMAELAADGLTGEVEHGNNYDYEDLSHPVMPHLVFDTEELNLHYPPLTAPAEVDDPDADNDNNDPILMHGYRLAKDILQEMESLGRTRRHARIRHAPGTTHVASDLQHDGLPRSVPVSVKITKS